MIRTRLTWVVIGGVVTLLFVAGVDALRFSADNETSAPTASTTATEVPTSSVSPCTQLDLRVSVEIRQEAATVVVRNIGAKECYRLLRGWRLRIEDRAGNLVAEWVELRPLADGLFPSGSEMIFLLPRNPVLCDSPGPYLALASVGPYSARRGNLSRSEIACGGGTRASRLRAKYITEAQAICRAATASFGEAFTNPGPELTELEETAVWSKAAARASRGALTELRALRAPTADRAWVTEIYSLMERQTHVLRQLAASASAGEATRVQMLSQKRIRLTHQKDGLVRRLTSLSGVPPDALYGCPISLPA
jgi:hypothetical protein